MNKDDLIRELRNSGSSWQTLVGVYVGIVSVMVLTGMSII